MKKLVAIEKERLCPQCRKGRMLANGLRTEIVFGEFVGYRHRRCSNQKCQHKDKEAKVFVGFEIDIEITDLDCDTLFES